MGTTKTERQDMNIIDGDRIEIREQNHTATGTVVGVEDGIVLADFGGERVGRIPVEFLAANPSTHRVIKTN
jgi:hypothetical protein